MNYFRLMPGLYRLRGMPSLLLRHLLVFVWSSHCGSVHHNAQTCETRPLPDKPPSLLQTAHLSKYRTADQDEFMFALEFQKQYLRERWANHIYGQPKLDSTRQRRGVLEASHVAQGQNLKGERIILHHIWKCGGTHLCELARESGFLAPLNSGCHRLVNDSALATNASAKWVPCAVGPGLASIPFQVVGQECPIDESTLSFASRAGFKWVGVLRDPIEQAYSWFAHAKRGGFNFKTLPEWIQQCLPPQSSCGWYTFIPNLQTRWLGGKKCHNEPEVVGCVEMALANLRQMAVVLEQRGNKLFGLPRLATLGWIVEAKPTQYVSGAQTERSRATEEEQAAIATIQHVDLELIRGARTQGII